MDIYSILVASTRLGRKIFFVFCFFIFEGVGVKRRSLLGRYIWPRFRELPVYFQPLIGSGFRIGLNRIDRTLGLAYTAVNTLIRMDHEHILAFIEAVDRTNLNAIGVFALDAVLVNDVGHASFQSVVAAAHV